MTSKVYVVIDRHGRRRVVRRRVSHTLRQRWVYPERETVVCLFPGPDVSCLQRGQPVLIADERRVVTRIDRKRNRLKAKPSS